MEICQLEDDLYPGSEEILMEDVNILQKNDTSKENIKTLLGIAGLLENGTMT